MDTKELNAWGVSQAIAKIIEDGFIYNEETGEIYFTSDDLDTLEETFENKINNLCGYLKYSKSKVEMLKERKKEIDDSQKYYEKRIESLSKYIDSLMNISGKDKLETNDYRLSFRKSKSAEIYDESVLREYISTNKEYENKYLKYKEPEISKEALKKDLENNNNIPGVRLIEKRNLQIK